MSTMNKSTAKEYVARLNSFRVFILNHYGSNITTDNLIVKIKVELENPYTILNNYAAFLLRNNVSSSTLKERVITVKNFLKP
jgi:hypothetical protein